MDNFAATQSAEAVAAEAQAVLLKDLEGKAIDLIERGRPTNLKLGRIFIRIKALLKHGEWKPYFANKFAPHGIPLRTATEYMRLAREEEGTPKKADSALFPPARDSQAVTINDAAEKDEAAVAAAEQQAAEAPDHDKRPKMPRRKRMRLDGIYRLPLYLTGHQKDNLDVLRDSTNWRRAEAKLIAKIVELCVEYGSVEESETKRFPRLPPGETLETAPIIFRDGKLTRTGRLLVQMYPNDQSGTGAAEAPKN